MNREPSQRLRRVGVVSIVAWLILNVIVLVLFGALKTAGVHGAVRGAIVAGSAMLIAIGTTVYLAVTVTRQRHKSEENNRRGDPKVPT